MKNVIPTDQSPHGDECRGKDRFDRDKKAAEKAAVLEIIQNEFPTIYEPSENKSISNEEVDALLAYVCGGQPGQQKWVRHNAVVAFLQSGVRNHNWDVEVPAYAIMQQPEKAIAHPGTFAQLPAYRAMVDAFRSSLELPTPASGPLENSARRYEAGQLIFSLISLGGLQNRHWLQQAVEALPSGVEGGDQLIWLDLQSGPQLRRWFPDPISALLMRRWFRRWQRQWPDETAENLLKEFFASLAASQMTVVEPQSLSSILNAAVTASGINHSGFIRNYQTTRNSSFSLPEMAWHRLQTKGIPARSHGGPDQETYSSKTSPVVDSSVLVGSGTEDGLAALDHLLGAFRSKRRGKTPSRKIIADSLAKVSENERLAPIVRVLSLWCRGLLMSRTKSGKNQLAISSVRTYLSTIARPLTVALATVTDLNELGDDDWEYVYERVISDAKSSSHRMNRAIQDRDFHNFLVEHYAFPEVYIEQASGGQRVVDADILTPAEYVRSKEIIKRNSADSRTASIRNLVLTLGFRCGLRRGEVQKIQVRDLPGVSEPELDNPELLIRPSAFGSVKTNAGIRRLPLSVLLTREELQELRYWTQLRLSEQVAPRPMELLFCERHQSNRVLSSLELFSPIQAAMQMASGMKLRFHHLRHSFATFIGLRLLESTPGALMRKAWAEDDNGEVVMPHWGGDFSALAHLASANSTSGKRLWLLAQWCGHVTPGETLQSYSHLIDWVSFQERLVDADEPLSIAQQAYLLDDSEKSVSVFRSRNSLKGTTLASELFRVANRRWPAGFRRKTKNNLHPYQPPAVSGPALEEMIKPRVTAMKMYNIFMKIGALQARGNSEVDAIDAAASYYSQRPEDVARWHHRAMRMMNDPTDKNASLDEAGNPNGAAASDSIHRRWSEDHQNEMPNPFVSRSGHSSATLPELSQCPAPPTPHVAQEYSDAVFERLVSWSGSEPDAFSDAINAIQNAMQRSHSQISFRSDGNKKRYRQLLGHAGLCHLVTVHVKPPSHCEHKKGELKKYWSSEFEVSGARVKLSNKRARGSRSEWGIGQIKIRPDRSLGDAARQMTMSTVRFAIFMAAVVFDGDLAIDRKTELL